jgi:hypothetical protein
MFCQGNKKAFFIPLTIIPMTNLLGNGWLEQNKEKRI